MNANHKCSYSAEVLVIIINTSVLLSNENEDGLLHGTLPMFRKDPERHHSFPRILLH